MEELVRSEMFKDVPWQMMIAASIAGFFTAPAMIIGGIAGWFGGAGKFSGGVALAAIVLGPIALYILMYYVLSPYGMIYSNPISGGNMMMIKVALSDYFGRLAAMLIMFFLFRRARIGWMNRFTPNAEAL